MSYRWGMSAAKARDEGLEVPATVPDCAVLRYDSTRIRCRDPFATTSPESGMYHLDFVVEFVGARWEWVSANIILGPKEAP